MYQDNLSEQHVVLTILHNILQERGIYNGRNRDQRQVHDYVQGHHSRGYGQTGRSQGQFQDGVQRRTENENYRRNSHRNSNYKEEQKMRITEEILIATAMKAATAGVTTTETEVRVAIMVVGATLFKVMNTKLKKLIVTVWTKVCVLWVKQIMTIKHGMESNPMSAILKFLVVQHTYHKGGKWSIHIIKEVSGGKFGSKVEKCVMLGYAQTGYRLWNIEKQKVIISRDVEFNEFNEKVFWYNRKIDVVNDDENGENNKENEMEENYHDTVIDDESEGDDTVLGESDIEERRVKM
ncbi:hypothetical protein QE152_g880 [Popillia japonica]|uniref:Retroviral polymerase SH3-like domain-containing protein n=1 Tax=Popillia japonica TaxID=7064 RepID=A0AAW1N7Y8_POPJA